MTVTVYARSDITTRLIEDGQRSWSSVMAYAADALPLRVNVGVYSTATSTHIASLHFAVFGFTFETEAAAMAFRLRHDDYLVDRPSHPDCDALMALEAA